MCETKVFLFKWPYSLWNAGDTLYNKKIKKKKRKYSIKNSDKKNI